MQFEFDDDFVASGGTDHYRVESDREIHLYEADRGLMLAHIVRLHFAEEASVSRDEVEVITLLTGRYDPITTHLKGAAFVCNVVLGVTSTAAHRCWLGGIVHAGHTIRMET
jgi:hypothetical protein